MIVEGKLRFIGFVNEGDEIEAEVRVLEEFCPGLKGVEEFSHLIVLYWMHCRDDEVNRRTLLVFPRRHAVNTEVGVFACRSPSRPNPIGHCIVELKKVEDCVLVVRGLDADVGSPIIDIKPYLPRADAVPGARVPAWTLHGPRT